MTEEPKPDGPTPGDSDDQRERRRPSGDAEPVDGGGPAEPEERGPGDTGDRPLQRGSFMEKRRDKIRAEIERNRRGEYTVPTWVLVVALIAVLAGWAAIIIFA